MYFVIFILDFLEPLELECARGIIFPNINLLLERLDGIVLLIVEILVQDTMRDVFRV